MSYCLGIEIKQIQDKMFMNQKKFTREVLKKLKTKDYVKVSTLVKYKVKLSKNNEEGKINSTTFKSLVESLRYLTHTHLDILYGVRFVERFIKTPIMTHFKALKRILLYLKGTIYFGLFYGYFNNFDLVGYNNNKWVRDMSDRNSTTCFVFYIDDTIFT